MTIERIAGTLRTFFERIDAGRSRAPAPGKAVVRSVDEPPDAAFAADDNAVALRLAGPVSLNDYPAMRLDLAELRTIAWRVPNAAALAVAWQAQAAEHTAFPVYVWSGAKRGGMQMALGLVDPDEEGRPPRPRRRQSRAVRIEFEHPSLGHIAIEVRWRLGGIQMTLMVEAAVAHAARSALPAVVAALSRANLRLVRVRLLPGRAPALRSRRPVAARPETGAVPDTRLFRAAAEAAATLLNPGNRRC